MLRIPAAQILLPVIAELICDRINVNATLVFSETTYQQVGDAYLRGLESLIQQGESVSDIKSVSIGIVNSSSLLTVHCQPSTVNRQHHSGVTGNDIIREWRQKLSFVNRN